MPVVPNISWLQLQDLERQWEAFQSTYADVWEKMGIDRTETLERLQKYYRQYAQRREEHLRRWESAHLAAEDRRSGWLRRNDTMIGQSLKRELSSWQVELTKRSKRAAKRRVFIKREKEFSVIAARDSWPPLLRSNSQGLIWALGIAL